MTRRCTARTPYRCAFALRRERVEGRGSNLSLLKEANGERERERETQVVMHLLRRGYRMCEMWSETGPRASNTREGRKSDQREGQNIVGVDGSETRNTGLYRLFLSRQGRVSKFRHAGRVLNENERKRSSLRSRSQQIRSKRESEGENKCREDKCHRDRPLIYYGGSE